MLVLKTDIVESTLGSVSTKIFLTTFNWSLFWILGGIKKSYMNAEIIYPIQVQRNHGLMTPDYVGVSTIPDSFP